MFDVLMFDFWLMQTHAHALEKSQLRQLTLHVKISLHAKFGATVLCNCTSSLNRRVGMITLARPRCPINDKPTQYIYIFFFILIYLSVQKVFVVLKYSCTYSGELAWHFSFEIIYILFSYWPPKTQALVCYTFFRIPHFRRKCDVNARGRQVLRD